MLRYFRFRSAGIPLATLLTLASPAFAAAPESLGAFKDWGAFSFDENGQKVCYMAAQPKKSEGNYSSRGEIHLLITHRPAEKSYDVVSVITGYTYQENSEATVQIGNQSFRLFTNGETAWARDEKTDKSLVDAIRKARMLVIKGTSSRGTVTTDTYSLDGSSAAYDDINQACGVKR
jgi:hypothetical protein